VHVHDEDGECRVGDIIEVMGCRPMSKLKRWRFLRIVRRPDTAEVVAAIGESLPTPDPETTSSPSSEEVSS
jgi:small subunit ribosomal protein S17